MGGAGCYNARMREKNQEPWSLYIVRCRDGTYYTGIAKDLVQRLEKHNAGTAAKYTRSRRPVVIVHSEICRDKQEALRRELELKKRTRAQKEAYMKQQETNRKFPGKYRKEFPLTRKTIYLDHAGVAPLSKRVETAVQGFLRESLMHGSLKYPEWSVRTAEVRRNCADLINARWDEVALIRSTSHGLSIVSSGIDWKVGENVVIIENDFPSNSFPWEHLQKKGVEIRKIPGKERTVPVDDIAEQVDGRTRLVSVSTVQFATGHRMDLQGIGAFCRKQGVFFCVDAIQSLGLSPIDVRECNIDFLAADAHKWLLGPEGIGIFYCREGLAEQLRPPLVGWKSVEKEFSFESPEFRLKTNSLRFEEGSMNLMGIFGLGAAIELLGEIGIGNIEKRVQDLGDRIIAEAEKRGFEIVTPRERRERGGAITFRGSFEPEAVRDALRERRIVVNVRAGGLRLSPHFYNTEKELTVCFKEIDRLLQRGSR